MARNSEDIKTFEDIRRQHFPGSKETLDAINARLANAMDVALDEVQFTHLQREAFNKKGFWRSKESVNPEDFNRHVIIQGATSSGKTLVSEMAILDSLQNGNKKSIVLVPLRAMVRERFDQLREDLEHQGVDKVYPSSSDYQEHDGEIIEGNFTVAVIVYEKFFAMLSQSQSKGNGENIPMLNECPLLVVDELQMLNSRDRGPKLEIAIQKVLENNKRSDSDLKTRIMCLTTCDCKVERIKNWLTVEAGADKRLGPILIMSRERPAGLREHVIELGGKFKSHRTYGEREKIPQESEDPVGEMKVPAVMGRNKEVDKKNALFKKLLEKIYDENPEAKVLVYVNGRRKTQRVAEFVARECSRWLPIQEMSNKMKKIYEFDGDDYTDSLREKLLPRRIAFHNASLSAPLREFIEKLFRDNEYPLRLVVATETLTIGMNMPVDVMILYDAQTRRLSGPVPLTNQEYKNFVGRAGRLGNKNKCLGESYIFASDINELKNFWNNYVYYRAEEIKSALAGVKEKEQAPYYLNLLLGKKNFTLKDFENILKQSFAQKCADHRFNAKEICQALVNAKLCVVREDDEDDESYYNLTDFGAYISSYALNLETCKLIRKYFYNGLYMKKKIKGGLPTDVTAEDLEQYSLDIFYRLCCTEEVENIGQLKIPNSGAAAQEYRKICSTVEKTLHAMIDSGKCKLWPDSPIKEMLSDNYPWLNEHEEKEHLLRAILLWYWTKGYYLRDIKEETNFKFGNVAIVQEDISRIAEVVAYLLESISNCLNAVSKGFEKLAPGAIYRFSTCVNYGMPRNLVVIANKHVHGLDRRTILRIGELWKKKELTYASPDQMLMRCNESDLREIQKIINEEDRKEIIRALEEATFHENYEILLESIRNESNLSENAYDAVLALYNTGTNDDEGNGDLLQPLMELFAATEETAFKDVTLEELLYESENALKFSCGEKNFALIAFDDRAKSVDYKKYGRFIGEKNLRGIVLFKDESSPRQIKWRDDCGTLTTKEGEVLLENISLAMTFKQFAFLLIQALKIKDNDARLLTALLEDTTGDSPTSNLSNLSTLGMLLNNFAATEANDFTDGAPDLPTLHIVCDKRKHTAYNDLLRELKRQKISYRILSWGDALDAEDVHENFYLIHLDWRVVQGMRSLRTFCTALKKTGYKKTFAIFDSEENFREWGGNPEYPHENLAHCSSTKNFSADVPNKIKPFLQWSRDEKFLIGVSYSHDSKGLELLKKFVDKLKETFPEEKIFFDEYPSAHSRLQGRGGAERNPTYYKQCEFFLVLDDPTYNAASEACANEFKAISERIDELPEISGERLWFLRLPGNKPCAFFDEGRDYYTRLEEETLEDAAKSFIRLINENFGEGAT